MDRTYPALVSLSALAFVACGQAPLRVSPQSLPAEATAAEAAGSRGPRRDRGAAAMPATMLWVWHGASDLRALPVDHGVAFLARTVRLRRDELVVQPRRSPVLLAEDTYRVAVIHIELDERISPADLVSLLPELTRLTVDAAREPAVRGVQLDFDAPRSLRRSYRELQALVRRRLPAGASLSMTALGSWCVSDRWLAEAPVDFVVPMVFGPDHEQEIVRARLERDGALPEPRCQRALGLREGDSVDAPGARFYFPTRGPWTLTRVEALSRSSR